MFDKLEEGLSTKIGEENKGFKLLQKLGFKQGERLGKKEVVQEIADAGKNIPAE